MPLYTVDHRDGAPTARYERSPVIALQTDASCADALPTIVRDASDSVELERLDALRTGKVPRGADAVISWFSGDLLLQGSAAAIRQDLRTPGRRCFVPFHLPCLTELDLLCVAPLWLSGGRMQDYWSSAARVAGTLSPSAKVVQVLSAIDSPWAQLIRTLLSETAKPGSGVEGLARLANDAENPPHLAALALRNLIVLLLRHKELAKAQQVLEGAMSTCPSYVELLYVGAFVHIAQQKPSKALGLLERARVTPRNFVGSGGENSYRAGWLLGRLAAQVGNQKVAFEQFYQGMVNRPVFAPAVDEILNLRLSPALVEKHEFDFCRLVRREPRYLAPVFDYLLLHRAFPAARRIAETMPLNDGERETLREKLESAERPFLPGYSGAAKPGVMLSGPLFEHSSFARINREIAISLMQSRDFDSCIEPCCHPELSTRMTPGGELLAKGLLRHPKQLDVTIRHQWPPDFERPSRGKLAAIVPWEYGAVPRVWVREIEKNVDELWVPSNFVRDVLVRAGVSGRRVRVIPNGIDPKVFSPEGPTSRPRGCRKFMFLFVGGAIRRKGIDLLLEAYKQAFDAGEDVTLVVSTGLNRAYAHNSQNALLSEFAGDPRLPHLSIVPEHLDDASLASLYRGCDAFVLPYRGEGFGMPIAEAMACGKPVVVTGAGPASEFCPSDCGYFIPAKEVEVPEAPPPLGELVGEWTWFEPDVAALASAMRGMYENRDEAARRGRNAAAAIRRTHAWERIVPVYMERIAGLTEKQPAEAMVFEQMAR
jgi:glycosyltransferase involved in cell wall biosynthesis